MDACLKKGLVILLNKLYMIIESGDSEIKVKFANKEHPIFKAHFPKNPILPGFLQIDIIADILNDKITKIKYCKFIQSIYPLDEVIYSIKTIDNQKSILVFKNSKKISEIKYETSNR